ncbi:hypothetical protein E2320_017458 [Naja naja]|nr:hypothetical protein E2320_017458 [Naja naja]
MFAFGVGTWLGILRLPGESEAAGFALLPALSDGTGLWPALTGSGEPTASSSSCPSSSSSSSSSSRSLSLSSPG